MKSCIATVIACYFGVLPLRVTIFLWGGEVNVIQAWNVLIRKFWIHGQLVIRMDRQTEKPGFEVGALPKMKTHNKTTTIASYRNTSNNSCMVIGRIR